MDYLNKLVIYKNFVTKEERQQLYDHAVNLYDNGKMYVDRFYSDLDKKLRDKYGDGWMTRSDLPPSTRHRAYLHTINNYNGHPLIPILHKRIESALNLKQFNYDIDPLFGFLLSYIQPGAYVQPHRDMYWPGNAPPYWQHKLHIRMNLMIGRGDDKSYNPHTSVFNDDGSEARVSHPVNLCDAWCFPASRIVHFTHNINGKEPRIVYQFGFAIDTPS
jgi:hypothetical protein